MYFFYYGNAITEDGCNWFATSFPSQLYNMKDVF